MRVRRGGYRGLEVFVLKFPEPASPSNVYLSIFSRARAVPYPAHALACAPNTHPAKRGCDAVACSTA